MNYRERERGVEGSVLVGQRGPRVGGFGANYLSVRPGWPLLTPSRKPRVWFSRIGLPNPLFTSINFTYARFTPSRFVRARPVAHIT